MKSICESFITAIYEAEGRIRRKQKIRDGKRIMTKEKEYTTECPDGYRRDSETGKCTRMSQEEKSNRSDAATKAANKPSTKRNKETSNRRRDSLIKD
jgi:hypothetical protein